MSKGTIITSLLSAVIGGLIVGGMFILYAANSDTFRVASFNEHGERAGYKMLVEFQCPYGTTKHLLLNGVDDNFTYGNPEPSRRNERLSHLPGLPINLPYKRDYDEPGRDKVLIDYFEIPPNVTRGLFVTRIEPSDNYGNDYMLLGEVSGTDQNNKRINSHTFNSWLSDLDSGGGWSRSPGNLYHSRLKDINFRVNDPKHDQNIVRDFKKLLPYLQSKKDGSVIDFMVYDDTAVDFAGMAVCEAPAEKMGLTFAKVERHTVYMQQLLFLGCDLEPTAAQCNPIYGDTACDQSLPLACFIDTEKSVPNLPSEVPYFLRVDIMRYWSGGDIDFTPAVRGDTFKTLSEANEYCAQAFGDEWRVLDFHDGGDKGVASYPPAHIPKSRVWLDIKDQPKGTCWARDNTRRPLQNVKK